MQTFSKKMITWSSTILLLAVVIYLADLDFTMVTEVSGLDLFIIGLLSFGLLLQNAFGVHFMLALFRTHIPLGEAWHFAQFYGLVNYLPLKVSMIGQAAHLKIKYKFPVNQFMLATIATYLLNLIVFTVFVIAAFAFVGSEKISTVFGAVNLDLFIALALGVIALTFVFLLIPLKLPGANKYLDYINLLLENRRLIFQERRPIFLLLGVIIIGTFLLTLRIWVGLAAFGTPVSFAFAVILGVAASFSFLISITPAGLGIKEAFLGALTFLLLGDAAIGVAVALMNRLFDFAFVGLFGSWSFLQMRKRGIL
jgi:hypothetical protein